jgi:2-succinyl-5-enolpyruvyl-6-hydroxy-3-cyclohexene-1-carboxylate synthase
MRTNGEVANEVLHGLARLGVREFCIAAGARNAPLLSVLLASSGIRIYHFFDERSAAFFALGRCIVSKQPVAVVTTSGTAAAELLPAAIEAYYQGAPLVLVTADRPRSYRGTGAPQAIEQVDLFGPYSSRTLDLDKSDATIDWPTCIQGIPFHLNVCLDEPVDEPISGIVFPLTQKPSEAKSKLHGSGQSILESWLENRDGLVVLVGGLSPEKVDQVSAFLRAVNAPVLAEATSNLSNRSELSGLLLHGGEKSLRGFSIKRVLRIGAVPSWSWWRHLESHPEIAVLNICEPGFPGLARKENVETAGWGVLDFHADHCVGAVSKVDSSKEQSALENALFNQPLSEVAWIRSVSESIPSDARVLLGNSLPIREWNLAAETPKSGTIFFANRGANGIDGQISTFFGIGAEASESWVICGDLTALYDLSAPWILRQLQEGNRRIVVINNHGGRIFSRMAAFRSMGEEDRQRVENAHSLTFEPWARMWGIDYRLCVQPGELKDLPSGPVLIEIRPNEEQSQAFWAAWST